MRAAFGEARKEVVDVREGVGAHPVVGHRERAHFEVLVDGHLAEDDAPLRDIREAKGYEPVGAEAGDWRTGECDRPGLEAGIPGDGFEHRRLAGAVRADQAHEMAGVDHDVDAAQDRDAPVPRVDVGACKQDIVGHLGLTSNGG